MSGTRGELGRRVCSAGGRGRLLPAASQPPRTHHASIPVRPPGSPQLRPWAAAVLSLCQPPGLSKTPPEGAGAMHNAAFMLLGGDPVGGMPLSFPPAHLPLPRAIHCCHPPGRGGLEASPCQLLPRNGELLQNLPAPALLSKEPSQGKPVHRVPRFQIRFTNLISYSLI